MLSFLSIDNVVLIKHLELSFCPNLTVMTGETGAGKSILLDSLGIVLGNRTNSSIIREGTKESKVTAVFEIDPGHPVLSMMKTVDITPPAHGDPIILRRIITKEGRSRAYLCDQPVSLTVLKKIAGLLVEIQGQHEQINLTETKMHRKLLDNFGTNDAILEKLSKSWHDWRDIKEKLKHAYQEIKEAQKEEEWLLQTIEDLEKISPQEGEDEDLSLERITLQQNERRHEAIGLALHELFPQDVSRKKTPFSALRNASRALSRLAPTELENDIDTQNDDNKKDLEQAIITLEQTEELLSETENILNRLFINTSTDLENLEKVEERLFTLRSEARKHNITPHQLPTFLENLQEKLKKLKTSTDYLNDLKLKEKEKKNDYIKVAKELSKIRCVSAQKLEEDLKKELIPLKLEQARLKVEIIPLEEENWNENGLETIHFLIATNPGQTPSSIKDVASGGELSRLLLALKVLLAGKSPINTIIFDEIDSGVGGATASAIGERLYRISKEMQVITITHSPQIAAYATEQLKIMKTVENKQTITSVKKLTKDQSCEEIARMLSGNHITPEARAAASSLMRGYNHE